MHYLPLSLPFFSILVGVFAVLLVLLQIGTLRYAYLSIGLGPGGAMLVLLGLAATSTFHWSSCPDNTSSPGMWSTTSGCVTSSRAWLTGRGP